MISVWVPPSGEKIFIRHCPQDKLMQLEGLPCFFPFLLGIVVLRCLLSKTVIVSYNLLCLVFCIFNGWRGHFIGVSPSWIEVKVEIKPFAQSQRWVMAELGLKLRYDKHQSLCFSLLSRSCSPPYTPFFFLISHSRKKSGKNPISEKQIGYSTC